MHTPRSVDVMSVLNLATIPREIGPNMLNVRYKQSKTKLHVPSLSSPQSLFPYEQPVVSPRSLQH